MVDRRTIRQIAQSSLEECGRGIVTRGPTIAIRKATLCEMYGSIVWMRSIG
jgi:hypothetical protein